MFLIISHSLSAVGCIGAQLSFPFKELKLHKFGTNSEELRRGSIMGEGGDENTAEIYGTADLNREIITDFSSAELNRLVKRTPYSKARSILANLGQ